MSVFRRRRGHPILSFIAAVFGFYFTDDQLEDQYYTDDALNNPLVYEDE